MRTLLIASPRPGVGNTTLALNLAAAGALSGARVLLIDADPHHGLKEQLALDSHVEQAALKDMGLNETGRMFRHLLPNLDLLTPFDAESETAHALEAFLRHLKLPYFEKYDWCVFDALPLSQADASPLAQVADEVILGARLDSLGALPQAELQQAATSLQQANGKLLIRGIMLALAEGEEPGGETEQNVRQTLGRQALPLTLPFDPLVGQARASRQILLATMPGSPAAIVLKDLAEAIGLARPGSAIIKPTRPKNVGPARPVGEKPKSEPLAAVRAAAAVKQLEDPAGTDFNIGFESPAPPAAKKDAARRNEVRSFLDLEPLELPSTGLDSPFQSGSYQRLDDHLNRYKPARNMPQPRAPVAPPPPPPPPPKPASRPPVGSRPPGSRPSAAQLNIAPAPPPLRLMSAAPQEMQSGSALLWIVGFVVFILLGLGIGFFGMWASQTGNLQLFLAFVLGTVVTVGVLAVGLLFGRSR